MDFPKVIHQTWKTTDVPDHWQESVEKWQVLHPEWSYHFTTDADNRAFCATEFPEYLDVYDGLKYPIQRADMIRYMYLWAYGGVYSDLDIVPVRPLEDFTFDLRFDVYLCASGNTASVYTNSFMISKPGCQLWIDLLEHIKHYRPWPLTLRHVEIMCSTGPLALSAVATKSKYKIFDLPSKLFMRFSAVEAETLNCKEIAHQEGTFTYPLVGNSWHAWDSKLIHYTSKLVVNKAFLVALAGLWVFLVKKSVKTDVAIGLQ